MKEIYQVNLTEKVDGSRDYWTSKWDADGYVGTLVDTTYEDGVDQTTWCLFTGTQEECEHWVSLQPNLKMYEFHTTNGNFEDGHADGYIWNVVYRNGKPTFLSEEEIKAFLESYYEMEVTLNEDSTWANCTWIPDEDSWWEGRVSLQEFVWDEEADTEYSSGRQPTLDDCTKTYYVQQRIGGWRQNAAFSGTRKECADYYFANHLNSQCGWNIVAEEDYKVDYL